MDPVQFFSDIITDMPAMTKQNQSFLAAVLLSSLTIAVFAAARDSGPESALRRLNEAIKSGDRMAQGALFEEPHNDPFEGQLAGVMNAANQAGLHFKIGRIKLRGREAWVEAAYLDPGNSRFVPIQFALVKPDRRWLVSSHRTSDLNQAITGP